jgi:hypothetical protein
VGEEEHDAVGQVVAHEEDQELVHLGVDGRDAREHEQDGNDGHQKRRQAQRVLDAGLRGEVSWLARKQAKT